MNRGKKGVKASELIRLLQEMISKNGDQPVYCGGGDYPDGATVVSLQERDDPYVPKGSFRIW